jgi:hypothetical protein
MRLAEKAAARDSASIWQLARAVAAAGTVTVKDGFRLLSVFEFLRRENRCSSAHLGVLENRSLGAAGR